MKLKKLLYEIIKSGLVPLILGFYIYFSYAGTSFFILSLVLIFVGSILGYNYTKPNGKCKPVELTEDEKMEREYKRRYNAAYPWDRSRPAPQEDTA